MPQPVGRFRERQFQASGRGADNNWRTPIGVRITPRPHQRRTTGGSMSRMTALSDRARKVLVSLVVIGLVGVVAGLGAYSAFTSTTTSSGNSFASGTVSIADND